MKTFFSVGLTAAIIAFVATLDHVTAAEDQQIAQAVPGAEGESRANPLSAEESAAREKEAAEIEASLAELSEEERELAEAQGFCPVMVKNRLGIMGTPTKVMIKDQPVFLCCKGCNRRALANPDKTLAVVEKLKMKVAEAEISASLAKLSREDRALARAQGYCPVMTDSRLGSMGPPVKVMVNDQPVFLCCKGCHRRALANPDQTLAIVVDLRAKVAEEAAAKAKVEARANQK
ncbi:MAG: hypothetical protein WD851_20970 [Pirellulales bacterium]